MCGVVEGMNECVHPLLLQVDGLGEADYRCYPLTLLSKTIFYIKLRTGNIMAAFHKLSSTYT